MLTRHRNQNAVPTVGRREFDPKGVLLEVIDRPYPERIAKPKIRWVSPIVESRNSREIYQ